MAIKSSMPKKAKKPLTKNVSPRMKSQTELAAEIGRLGVINEGLKQDLERSENVRIGQQQIIQNERKWKESYQEENGKLHLELLAKRIGSLLIGVGLGLLLAALIVYLY